MPPRADVVSPDSKGFFGNQTLANASRCFGVLFTHPDFPMFHDTFLSQEAILRYQTIGREILDDSKGRPIRLADFREDEPIFSVWREYKCVASGLVGMCGWRNAGAIYRCYFASAFTFASAISFTKD